MVENAPDKASALLCTLWKRDGEKAAALEDGILKNKEIPTRMLT